jgi:hypothetical protein
MSEQYAASSVLPVTVQLQSSYSQGCVIVLMMTLYPKRLRLGPRETLR